MSDLTLSIFLRDLIIFFSNIQLGKLYNISMQCLSTLKFDSLMNYISIVLE